MLDIPLLELDAGRTVGLAGPSGSGKTTLLNLCAGLMRPTAGRIWVDGEEVTSLSQADLDRLRSERIGYVFQGFNLVPVLSAIDNVEVALRFAGRLSATQRRARAEELLKRVGLADRMHLKPAELSHGQMQRVGIARAVANRPKLLLADEPTASLEPGLGEEVTRLLVETAQEAGATLLVATHDSKVLDHMQETVELSRVNRAGAAK